MHTEYLYTTNTYREKRWYKPGETGKTAIERIEEQDTTSNPEALIPIAEQDVPNHITDKKIRKWLEKNRDWKETRLDKTREWREHPLGQNAIEEWRSAINDLWYGVARPNSYLPRNEQTQCIKEAVKYFRLGGEEFLINAKMRFGKTFTSYHIAKELEVKNLLILTYKPQAEEAWQTDLNEHVAFEGWHYSNGHGFHIDKKTKINVIFASFQDINNFGKPKWRGIRNHKFDMIVVDEMHYGSETDRAKLTLSNLKTKWTLFVSGTPLDAIVSGRFTEDNMFTWSYADEQRKRRDEEEAGWLTEIYRWLPVMEIHTFSVCEEAKRTSLAYTQEEQFTMTKMFGSTDGKTFNDEASVKLFLDQVFGRGVRKDKSPIRTHATDHMLWVMPPSVNSVGAMVNLLKRIEGNEYHIINAAGTLGVKKVERLKRLIKYYDKTITVTCGRFNTGVTVPQWDAVYMLGDGQAPETYFQTIFRVQNPDKSRSKEKCYVFDFNPERVLKLIYEYAALTAKRDKPTISAVREFLEFAPVIDHSGNELKQVSTEDIVSFVTETSHPVEMFASSYIFNKDKALSFTDLLSLEGGITNVKSQKLINTNEMKSGKNFIHHNHKSPTKTEKALTNIIIEKARYLTKHIPEYVMFVDPVKSVYELTQTDADLFKEHFQITRSLFRDMVKSGFLNEDRLNRLITGLQQ